MAHWLQCGDKRAAQRMTGMGERISHLHLRRELCDRAFLRDSVHVQNCGIPFMKVARIKFLISFIDAHLS